MEREPLSQAYPLNITDRLPPELLSHIFHLVLLDSSGLWRQEWIGHLVSVSRRWRDVIHGCPNFWTAIVVQGNRSLSSSVETHLTRSHNCLLDIEIQLFRDSECPRLEQCLGPLIDHSRRWRSLVLCLEGMAMQLSLESLSTIPLPSLTRAVIQNRSQHGPCSLRLLKSEQFPVLRHLEIEGFPWDNVPLLPPLTTLKFKDMRRLGSSIPPVLSQLSSLKLTSLFISGSLDSRWLLSNSLHLPFLEILTIDRTWKSKEVLEAIVAPKLGHLTYSAWPNNLASFIFGGLGSKYHHVHQLTFHLDHRFVPHLDYADAEAVCSAFSGICRASILPAELDSFFLYLNDSCPADRWTSLEHLTIESGDVDGVGFSALVRWINMRAEERRWIHVQLTGTRFADQSFLHLLDGVQKEWCMLEMDVQPSNFG